MKAMMRGPLEDIRDLRDCCDRDLDRYAGEGDTTWHIYKADTRIILALTNAEIARRVEQR